MRGYFRVNESAVEDSSWLASETEVFREVLGVKPEKYGLYQFLEDLSRFRLRDKRDLSNLNMMLGVRVDDTSIATSSANRNALVRFLRKSQL